MMKTIIITCLGVLIAFNIEAQQLLHSTPIQDLQHIWNPAFTAPGTQMDASAYYKKQWIGFEGAPNTAVASIQYPFVDMNMSAGAMIISDRTGAVAKTGLQLNYAYKLKELLNRDDQLSIGINAHMFQYRFDPTTAVTFVEGDPLLSSSRETKMTPSFGGGIAYFSNTEEYSGDNIFYFGISALQFLESDILLEQGNAPRSRHYYVNMGTKLFGYKNYIEPTFQVNFVNPEIIDYVLSAKFEMEEAFWAGLSYSSLNDISMNGGVILDDFGGRHSMLKVGALASINGGAIMSAGASFELFVSYKFEMD